MINTGLQVSIKHRNYILLSTVEAVGWGGVGGRRRRQNRDKKLAVFAQCALRENEACLSLNPLVRSCSRLNTSMKSSRSLVIDEQMSSKDSREVRSDCSVVTLRGGVDEVRVVDEVVGLCVISDS